MVDEESFARVRRNRREAERGDVWRECNAPYSLSYDTTMLKLRWLKLNAAARAESKTEAVSRSSRQKPEHVLQLSDVCLPCPLLIPPPPFIPFAPFLYLSFSFSTTSPILSLSLSLYLPVCLLFPLFSIYRSLCLSLASPPSPCIYLSNHPFTSFLVPPRSPTLYTSVFVVTRRCIPRSEDSRG